MATRGAQHRYARVNDQVEEARKQTRLEELGQHFRVYTAPGSQPAFLPCVICMRSTLGRIQLSSMRYAVACPDHDAWTVASLVYVEAVSQDEIWDAYQARRSRDGC